VTDARTVVRDEIELLSSLVPLEGADVLELGCGNGAFARKVLERTGVASVTALEVDAVQHRKNLEARPVPRLRFGTGGAEDIPCGDASVDGVVMMKSLHHVPVARMDRAMREIARVLKPGGWVYFSEPVYAGPLNDIIKLFHDEGVVRAEAYRALERARRDGVLEWASEHAFDTPARYRDYDDFVAKHVQLTHSQIEYPPEVAAEVRRRLEAHMTPEGAKFMRPNRVNLMRRAK
jgi:ubiquinone/menaquinone biosynthesis C-methylase UbiE